MRSSWMAASLNECRVRGFFCTFSARSQSTTDPNDSRGDLSQRGRRELGCRQNRGKCGSLGCELFRILRALPAVLEGS
eukprot:s1613_g2.t1